jgi:uncharacterized membrane protein YgdD (TMEM256/DUF423 family)
MTKTHRLILILAALCGGLAVAMGAFAAHGVADDHARDLLRTGALYALTHAVAALAVAARSRGAAAAFVLGGLVFSAALYGLALGGPPWLGAIAPVGGLAMIVGWGWTAIAVWREGHKSHP